MPNEDRAGRAQNDPLVIDARRFLRGSSYISIDPDRPSDWLEATAQKIRIASDAQRLEVVAHILAIYLQVDASPDRDLLIQRYQERSSSKRTSRTHDLHLIAEQMISYGGNTKDERLAAQKLRSRDVRAIRYLMDEGVPPSEVKNLGMQNVGEGLHEWAKRFAQGRKGKLAREVRQQETPKSRLMGTMQRAVRRKITWTEHYPNGDLRDEYSFQLSALDKDVE